MRATVSINGETYNYDPELFLIISEKGNARTIPFANNRERCSRQLFWLAYSKGIYLIGRGEEDDEEESFVDRLIHNKIPFFVGEGIYDINEQPIFLMWWNSFTYQGEVVKLISIQDVLLLFNDIELKDIFLKLAQVADIEINGKIGFGSCRQLVIKYDDCWERLYSKDFYLIKYLDSCKPGKRRN
jgi:hypothetical protein